MIGNFLSNLFFIENKFSPVKVHLYTINVDFRFFPKKDSTKSDTYSQNFMIKEKRLLQKDSWNCSSEHLERRFGKPVQVFMTQVQKIHIDNRRTIQSYRFQ